MLLNFIGVGDSIALCPYGKLCGYTLPMCFSGNYFIIPFILGELLLPCCTAVEKKRAAGLLKVIAQACVSVIGEQVIWKELFH